MSFIKVLLTDKRLYVRCGNRDQITKLEDWAGKRFVFEPRPRAHQFYYANVADGVVVHDKPERVISFGEALLHYTTGPAFDSTTAPREGFPPALLKNSNIWVKCTTVEQVKELSEWAFNNGKHKPTVFVKEAHESYYYNVPKEVCTAFPPAPMSTIIAFEDIDRRVAAKWKAGDGVIWPPMGEGKVRQVSPNGNVHVDFDKAAVSFYEVPSDLEKRIDWSEVAPGTIFEVFINETESLGTRPFRFFAEGKPWFGVPGFIVHAWEKYRRVEP